MDTQELKAIQSKFEQGLAKLDLLSRCLSHLGESQGLALEVESVETKQGELGFWFAGTRYAVRIRITDRGIDDVGPSYRVPVGWLDWARGAESGDSGPALQSNYYDDRGILCEEEKQEFYCNFESCDDSRVVGGLARTLQKLASHTIAVNNAATL